MGQRNPMLKYWDTMATLTDIWGSQSFNIFLCPTLLLCNVFWRKYVIALTCYVKFSPLKIRVIFQECSGLCPGRHWEPCYASVARTAEDKHGYFTSVDLHNFNFAYIHHMCWHYYFFTVHFAKLWVLGGYSRCHMWFAYKFMTDTTHNSTFVYNQGTAQNWMFVSSTHTPIPVQAWLIITSSLYIVYSHPDIERFPSRTLNVMPMQSIWAPKRMSASPWKRSYWQKFSKRACASLSLLNQMMGVWKVGRRGIK